MQINDVGISVGDIFHNNLLAYKIENITNNGRGVVIRYSLIAQFIPSTNGPVWFVVLSHPYENFYENFVKLYPFRLDANQIIRNLQVGQK